MFERATDMESDARKPQPASFYSKLQLGLLVCGVLMLASLVSMQFAMLRGFSQLADNVNSKSQGLESLSRFGELHEPVQRLITRGGKMLQDPSTHVLSALTNPWTAIQLFREGVPYLLSAEAMPGLLKLFDTLESSQLKRNLEQLVTQMDKMICTSRIECNRSATDIWGIDFQQSANEVHAWAKLILSIWPSNEDEVLANTNEVSVARVCEGTNVWADLICNVDIATQQFNAGQWSRSAQRTISIVQKLRRGGYLLPSYFGWSVYRGWSPTTPIDYNSEVQSTLDRVERGARLFV